MTVKVKVCGITNLDDALDAIELGADYLGFNFYPDSKRYVTLESCMDIFQDIPPSIPRVGVFVNANPQYVIDVATQLQLDFIQCHGDEDNDYLGQFARPIIKAIRPQSTHDLKNLDLIPADYLLIDSFVQNAYGGTGMISNWDLAREAARHKPIFLAGGLTPDNVAIAVQAVKPFAVDVASGVEVKGDSRRKDYRLMSAFIRHAKK